MVMQMVDTQGNRAFIDMNERGFVWIVNPKKNAGRHAASQPTLVEYASTRDIALEGLRQLTGTNCRVDDADAYVQPR